MKTGIIGLSCILALGVTFQILGCALPGENWWPLFGGTLTNFKLIFSLLKVITINFISILLYFSSNSINYWWNRNKTIRRK